MKRYQPVILALLLSGLFGLNAVGQASTAPDPSESFRWNNYLDPSLIMDLVAQGDEIYAATYGGLLVYHTGQGTFRQYSTQDGLPANRLMAVEFVPGGDVYLGTAGAGVSRVRFLADRLEVSNLTSLFHGLAGDNVNSLTAWGDTIVYGTDTGAGLIISGVAGATLFRRNGLPSEKVQGVLADGDRVWMATDSGMVILDNQGFLHNVTSNLPSIDARVIESSGTDVWAGTARGVARFNPADSSWTPLGLQHQTIYSLYLDGSTLWAGGSEYLYSHDGAVWDSVSLYSVYRTHNIKNSNIRIGAITRGADSNLYLGLADLFVEQQGADLVQYNGSSFQELRPNTLQQNRIIRFAYDTDGALWFNTWSFGLGKLTPAGNWINYNPTTAGGGNLSSMFLNTALVVDLDGTKWIGGLNALPLNELDDDQDENFGNDVWNHHDLGAFGGDGIGWLRFMRARVDPAGNIWFVGDQAAPGVPGNVEIQILSRDKSEWLQVSSAATGGQMWAGKTNDIAFSPDGTVYIASFWAGVQAWQTGGYDWPTLSSFSGDTWTTIGRVGVEFGSEDEPNVLALRGDGVLWIGTSKKGLYKYDPNQIFSLRFRHINKREGFGVGLLGGEVNTLLLDRENNLWVGTDQGLNRIAADEDNDIAAYTTPAAYQFELNLYYDLSVISPLVDAFVYELIQHPTEEVLYIGTKGGLSRFDISEGPPVPTELSKVYVYPNPVYGRKGHSELKIGELTGPVYVEIYSVEGERVHAQWVTGPDDPEAWDLTTDSGFLVSSGVYLVRITSEGQSVVRRVALIR